ncbi:acyltransferase [soil metagenome]|jgi:peptidoglycan/LPS O-acetylase OafA/YrhL
MQKKLFFPELESLRGIAALMVCFFHIYHWHIFKNAGVISDFNIFVDFFFVLSGFVITLNFSNIITDGSSYKAYLIKRFFRVYPLFLVTSIPYFVISILKTYFHASSFRINYFSVPEFLSYITLTFKWGFVDKFIFNAPTWSISVELLLYIIAGYIFTLKKSRAVNIALNLLIISVSLFILIIFSQSLIVSGSRLAIFRGSLSFFLGGLIAYGYQIKQVRRFTIQSALTKNACLFLILALVATGFYFMRTSSYTSFAFPLLWAAFIYFIISKNFPLYVAAFLNLQYILYLGTISYSLYLIHPMAIFVMEKIFKRESLETNDMVSLVAIPFYIALLVITASVTYRYIEKPGKQLYTKIGFLSLKKGDALIAGSAASAKT